MRARAKSHRLNVKRKRQNPPHDPVHRAPDHTDLSSRYASAAAHAGDREASWWSHSTRRRATPARTSLCRNLHVQRKNIRGTRQKLQTLKSGKYSRKHALLEKKNFLFDVYLWEYPEN